MCENCMAINVENSFCIINYWINDLYNCLVPLISIPITVTEVLTPLHSSLQDTYFFPLGLHPLILFFLVTFFPSQNCVLD